MPNKIGSARSRTFFKLTNRWRSDYFSVLFWGVFRVVECMELIWNLSKKYWGECTLSSKISSLHQHRFGSGGMSFSVRRVSYHKSVYTGNSIASAAKNILQNILFEYSTKTHKKKIPSPSTRYWSTSKMYEFSRHRCCLALNFGENGNHLCSHRFKPLTEPCVP